MNVSQLVVEARPTAVIAEMTSWDAYPARWPQLLEEVWSVVRPERGEIGPGRNVMPYKGDVPNVEVGVEIAGTFGGLGRVVRSHLPGGRVVMAGVRGYARIGDGHRAAIEECERLGLERLGPRWEIYGHEPGDEEVEVYYLVDNT